jgi:uncharacterized protein (TIGR03086 family)
MTEDVVADHRRACDGFARAITTATGHWDAPSPCPEWDARGIVEHVIGFHDALLLQPLDAKPHRPKDDPAARWAVTVDALTAALERPEALDEKRRSLLGVLTTEVLIHTWDLSRAIGVVPMLDVDLCETGYQRGLENQEQLRASDMFEDAVPVSEDASVQDKLLAIFGRDPNWRPPTG